MGSLWKILGRIAIGLLALIAVAIAAVVVITNTSWFREFARGKVNAILAGTFKGQLAIGRIQGSIWHELILDDITLSYHGDRIAHIERLRAAYGILSLLHNTIDLTHLDISGLQLDAKQDAHGNWNALEALASTEPEAPTEGGGKSRFRVLIREISLGRGSIKATRANGETYALDNSGLDGSVYILKQGLRARLDSLWGHLTGPQLPPGEIFASLTYQTAIQPGSVTFDVVKLDTHDSHLKLSGAISDLDAMKVDLRLEAKQIGAADIVSVTRQWSPQANVTGTISIQGSRPDLHMTVALNAADAKIHGDVHADLSESEPRYRGSLSVTDLHPDQLLASSIASGNVNASMQGQGSGTSTAGFRGHVDLRVAQLGVEQWKVGDLTVTADVAKQIATYQAKIAQSQRADATSRGRIDFTSTPKYEVALAASHLDVQKLQNGRAMHTDLNLAAEVKGSGIKLGDADAAARVDLKRSVLGPARIDSGVVRASIARGVVRIARASVKAGATIVTAKGEVALVGTRRGELSYNLKSDDLAPWMTLAGREGGGKLQVIGRTSGTLDALTVAGSASMTSLQSGDLSIGAGKITYALANVGGDTAHGRIDAGFDTVHTDVHLKALYVGVDLVRLHPTDARVAIDTWDAQKRHQELAAEVRLSPNALDLGISRLALEMADGTWQLTHPATIRRDAKHLAVQNLRLLNGQKEISLEGQATFGGAQNVTLIVNGFALGDLNPFLATSPAIAGTLSTSVRVTGTSARPMVAARMQIKPLSIRGYGLASST